MRERERGGDKKKWSEKERDTTLWTDEWQRQKIIWGPVCVCVCVCVWEGAVTVTSSDMYVGGGGLLLLSPDKLYSLVDCLRCAHFAVTVPVHIHVGLNK